MIRNIFWLKMILPGALSIRNCCFLLLILVGFPRLSEGALETYLLSTMVDYPDAEKSPTDPNDDLLCWATSASNLLTTAHWSDYGGLSHGIDLSDEKKTFGYFKGFWTNQAGSVRDAITWFFNGTNPDQNVSGWSQVSGGGNFWPEVTLSNYLSSYFNIASTAMRVIDTSLRNGRGVSILIDLPNTAMNHWLTCYGFRYDTDEVSQSNDYYQGLYFTDSDDGYEGLKYSELSLQNNNWILTDYVSARIFEVETLKLGNVPEPVTFFLYILGITLFVKRRS